MEAKNIFDDLEKLKNSPPKNQKDYETRFPDLSSKVSSYEKAIEMESPKNSMSEFSNLRKCVRR